MKSKDELKQEGFVLSEEGLPPFGQPVTVVTADFRCVGFLDRLKTWRHHSDKALIKDVIAWSLLAHEK